MTEKKIDPFDYKFLTNEDAELLQEVHQMISGAIVEMNWLAQHLGIGSKDFKEAKKADTLPPGALERFWNSVTFMQLANQHLTQINVLVPTKAPQ